MDRAPVVAIIGQASTHRLHKESHQNMDAIDMYKPITKWVQSIRAADTIPEIMRKAFKTAEAEKPGVSVIELPDDIAKIEVDVESMVPGRTRRPAADYKAIARAVEVIAQAKHPLILAGNGAVRKRAASQLARLARKMGIGVVNTFMGKGAGPMSDPHCLYTIGLQSRDLISQCFDKADVVIAIGYDLVENSPHLWNPRGDKRIVHIDFLPAEIDHDYPVEVDVVADLADALWQLNEAFNDRLGDSGLPLFEIVDRQAVRTAIHDDLHMEEADNSFPMKP
jgi:acetolactate synthase-1/2/3 large subunit